MEYERQVFHILDSAFYFLNSKIMKIIIKTKNLELTDSLDSLINKKMKGLEKFIKVLKKDFSEIFIEIEKETKHHKKGDVFISEAIIRLPGKSLVAKSHGDNLLKAITQVREELEREIKKYKTKIIELPRRKYRKTKRELL